MLASILRTVVPLIVGWVLTITIFSGVDAEALTSLITAAVTAAYYLVVRLLEKFDSKFGWLLGYAAQPRYADTKTEELVQKSDNLDLAVKIVPTEPVTS